MSLVDLTKRLRNETMDGIVASLGERQLAALRTCVLGGVVLWVVAWRSHGPQPVLVADAHAVYSWAVGVFLASAAWWIAVRTGLVRIKPWMDVVGTVANFLIIAILTKYAFLLLITLEAVLPFLAIVVGARYNRRWFKVSVVASLAVLLWSAPTGYWLSRPAYLVYAIVLTVGLPLLIGRILSALREVSLQALEARDAQNRFVGAMSHELRTPLNVIINSIALIDRRGMNQDQQALLDQSETNARALSHRVNNVLDITKHTAGRLELNGEFIYTREVMDAVRDVSTPAALERGIAFEIFVADNVPAALYGDPGRVEQVLSNLATNAIKYTPPGGRVDVSLEVRGVVDGDTAELVCTVVDTGIGIAEKDKARIFDAFYQVSNGDARAHGGVGLGLFIARNVTEQLGGSLSVDDNPEGGTIFTWRVRLPIAKGEQRAPRSMSIPDLLRDHRLQIASMRCLVVDDNSANVDIMRRLLEGAGHEMSVASDGPSGLEAIASGAFDMAFLDLHMPGMSGWDVLGALGGESPTPIVVLSAESNPDAAAAAMAMGAVAFVSKPIAVQRLLDTIQQVVEPQLRPVDVSPLSEMRQIGDAKSVGALLRHVEKGLAYGLNGIERALADGTDERARHHLHGLKNEFGTLGFGRSVELIDRIERATRAGGDMAGEMSVLKCEVQRVRMWIASQPERAATALT